MPADEGGGEVASERAWVDTPAYMLLASVCGIWTAASTGSSIYLRVPAGVFGVFWTALLISHLIKRRRKRFSEGPDINA
jgi:hypothetical protein